LANVEGRVAGAMPAYSPDTRIVNHCVSAVGGKDLRGGPHAFRREAPLTAELSQILTKESGLESMKKVETVLASLLVALVSAGGSSKMH
jgi:hypothetical protein